MKALLVEMTFERRGENTRKGQECQEGMCLDYLQKKTERSYCDKSREIKGEEVGSGSKEGGRAPSCAALEVG